MFYKIVKILVSIFFRLIYRVNIVNKENLPDNEKLIICSNHIHVFDPVLLVMVFPNQIHWMGKKELFENKFLNLIFSKLGAFPVDRDNVGLSTMRESINLLKNNKTLGVFPEGTRVKELDLNNAKPGVALISARSKAPILPVFIETTYKPFSKVNVYIGDEITFVNEPGEKLSSEDYKKMGEEVLRTIYNLKE